MYLSFTKALGDEGKFGFSWILFAANRWLKAFTEALAPDVPWFTRALMMGISLDLHGSFVLPKGG